MPISSPSCSDAVQFHAFARATEQDDDVRRALRRVAAAVVAFLREQSVLKLQYEMRNSLGTLESLVEKRPEFKASYPRAFVDLRNPCFSHDFIVAACERFETVITELYGFRRSLPPSM